MNLQSSTIFMIIGFLIIFGILIIIINQIRMLNAISSLKDFDYNPEVRVNQRHEDPVYYNLSETSGPQMAQGKAKLIGIEDGETVAVILSAVSTASSLPLSLIKIKSIKRVG